MYRVLVPVDHSEERATAQADYVVDLPGAAESVEAILLYVFTAEDEEGVPPEYEQFKTASRVSSVRRAQERLEDHGVAVTVLDDSGDAARDILDAADEHDVDAIVMGGRKRSPARKALFGSTTQSVLRETDLPVVVTGGED